MHTLSFESVTYKFDLIDLDGEKEWKAWVRQLAMDEAEAFSKDWVPDIRVPFLAKVSTEASLANCGFITEFGIVNLKTKEGIAKVLELGARKAMPNPHPPYEIMLRLVTAREKDAVRMAMLVIPISEEARTQLLGELEKKASGQTAGPTSPTSKSAAPSGANPGVSTPIRLAE